MDDDEGEWLALEGEYEGYDVHSTQDWVRSWRRHGRSAARAERPRSLDVSAARSVNIRNSAGARRVGVDYLRELALGGPPPADAAVWLPVPPEWPHYEVHVAEDRVRSWRLRGGAGVGRTLRPVELVQRFTGSVTLRDCRGVGRLLPIAVLREWALARAAAPAPVPPPSGVPPHMRVPPPPFGFDLEDLAARVASLMVARLDEDALVRRLVKEIVSLPAPPQLDIDELAVRLSRLLSPPPEDLGALRTVGGGGQRARPAGVNGKGAPWELQQHQLRAVVGALGIVVAADATLSSERVVTAVLEGRSRSVEDPARLDRLYVALRHEQLDDADESYDLMQRRVAKARVHRHRTELDDLAWSERG